MVCGGCNEPFCLVHLLIKIPYLFIVSLFFYTTTTASMSVCTFLSLWLCCPERKMDCIALFCIVSKDVMKKKEIASVGGKHWKGRNGFFSDSFADRQRKRKNFAGVRGEGSHH